MVCAWILYVFEFDVDVLGVCLLNLAAPDNYLNLHKHIFLRESSLYVFLIIQIQIQFARRDQMLITEAHNMHI